MLVKPIVKYCSYALDPENPPEYGTCVFCLKYAGPGAGFCTATPFAKQERKQDDRSRTS